MKNWKLDLKNYSSDSIEIHRTAARGIICHNNKYLIIHSKYGDYKFPGGGKKETESLEENLIREVKEETGFNVIKNSIKLYGHMLEIRKKDEKSKWIMDSYYYFCEIEKEQGNKNLDALEKEYEYKSDWMSLEEIIKNNEKVNDFEHVPWVTRENFVMKELLKDKK